MQNPQCLLCLVYLIKQQNRINKWYKQSLQAICQNLCASFATAGTWTGISNHLWKRTSNSSQTIWYFFHSIFLLLSPHPQPQNAKWHCILKSVRTWQAAGCLFSVNPLATSNPALTLDNVFFSPRDIIMAGNVLSSFLCLAVLNTWTLTGNRTGVHLACVYGHFKCL